MIRCIAGGWPSQYRTSLTYYIPITKTLPNLSLHTPYGLHILGVHSCHTLLKISHLTLCVCARGLDNVSRCPRRIVFIDINSIDEFCKLKYIKSFILSRE